MAATIVKVQHKGQVTIPLRLRTQAGISEGDLVEAVFERGKIILTPKPTSDLSAFPNADDEYTPRQRRIVDREIAKGLEDIKAGRTYGPYRTTEELVTSIKAELKKRAAKRRG